MSRLIFIFLLLMSGCANTNPFQVTDESAAILQNHPSDKKDQKISFIFVALDGVILEPSWNATPINASFRVPAGRRKVVARVVYTRSDIKFFGFLHMFEAETALSVELTAGHTYVVDATIDEGTAKIWVKDAANDRSVSEIVTQRLIHIKPSTGPMIIPRR